MNPNDNPESRSPESSSVDPRLIEKISLLDDLPGRDPRRASQGRAAFLASAQQMADGARIAGAPTRILTVTPAQERRHKGWMATIQSLFMPRRKEQSPMFTALSSVLIIIALALGGSGAAVAAAQSSQPDGLLYGLKLTSENLRLEMEGDPTGAWQLALTFSERRAFEIQTMLQAGGIPPEPVQARYQAQVEQAIQFALNQPDAQAVPALEQVRTRLQTQEQAMFQLQEGSSLDSEAVLARTCLMLRERLQWVEIGLLDPGQLREMLRQREQSGDPLPPAGSPGLGGAGSGPGPGDGECLTCTPASDGHNSQNPWTTGTPVPGSGYGPGSGDGECLTCTPASDGHNSQNPWTTGTPVPASGYGPGPGDGDGECAGCTPAYDGGSSQNPWTTGTPVSGTPVSNTPVPGSGYGPGPGPGDGECANCTPGAGSGPGPGPQPTPAQAQPTQSSAPTQAGPQPTQNQQGGSPTQAGPQPTQSGPGGKP